MTDHNDFSVEAREMKPLSPETCIQHQMLLERIGGDLQEMKTDQKALLEKLTGNGRPGLITRMEKQELISGALIFTVGVLFTGFVGVVVKLLTRHVGGGG